jgi:hypothetical protein
MEIKIEIKKRNLDFGIITWPLAMDFEVKTFFELQDKINLEFNGQPLPERKVSYKYRRFSIGKKRLESFEKKRFFILTKSNGNIKLTIK